MGKDIESSLRQRQLDKHLADALPFDDCEIQNTGFPGAMPCTIANPTNNASPAFGFSVVSDIKPGQLQEPRGWFYCMPRFRQGLMLDQTLHDKFIPKSTIDFLGASTTPTTISGHAPKQFLVFDQTGDKTSMMISSGISTEISRVPAWNHRPIRFYNSNEDELRISSAGLYSRPNLTDDGHGTDEGNDMPEDSEEINALLYSDEEDDNNDVSEETSTGSSPSTMTAYWKQYWLKEEDVDEVANSDGPVKRWKLSESDRQLPSAMYEDDAESSCACGKRMRFPDMGSSPVDKRIKREKIQETVSILQTILPGGKGKDAVMVLDEAINYLKTLKFTAESLGLSGGFG